MSEQLLIQQLQLGVQQAYAKLVDLYQNMVYNTVLSMLQNHEEAEDVSQEVFIQVYQSIQQFKGESKLSTWLYRIAVTKSLDLQRHKKRKKRFAFLESLVGVDGETKHDVKNFNHPGVNMENKEKAAKLFKAMMQLPDNQKAAFTLNKVEGLSYQEVADVLKVSIGSVEALLHRAKQNLRKELGNYYN